MAIPNLSMTQAVQRRETLLFQINEDLKKLNTDFQKNPANIDIETTYKLIRNLRKVNATIEKKKNENLKRKRCCNCLSSKGVKVTTYVLVGIHALAWIAVGGFAIYDLATRETDAERGRDIAEVVITVAALFLTTVVAGAIKNIDDDRDRFELLAKISNLEQQGEEHFQQFLLAFDDFKKSKNGDRGVQKQKLSKCVHHLDNLPESGYRNKIPSRDHWISLMIHLLPDNHPIKEKFQELRVAAMQIFELEEDGEELVYRKSSMEPFPKAKGGMDKPKTTLIYEEDSFKSDDGESYEQKHVKVLVDDKSGSDLSSTDSSPKTSRKFKGEKMALPSWFKAPSITKRIIVKVESSADDEEIMMDDLPLSSPSTQFYRQAYKREWYQLESDLGINLNCIQMEGHCFDRECNVSDQLDHLPTFRPSLEPLRQDEEFISDTDDMV